MNLYEITNGVMGWTVVQAFAWAPDEATALVLAREQYQAQAEDKEEDDAYYTHLRIRFLFSDDAAPFCTIPSSEGWYEEGQG